MTASAAPAGGAPITVLVVDDEPDLRMLVRLTLERSGGISVVDEAVDGPEALVAFRRLHPPPVPTVVILDNRMPGLSGLEVAAEWLAASPEQLIVLFSAHLTDAVEQQARTMGVAACLSKTEIHRLPALIHELGAGHP